tara:strand:+ start:64411 stop:65376 length:966 start_codon:yes stop_codon:yes gene_type:complete
MTRRITSPKRTRKTSPRRTRKTRPRRTRKTSPRRKRKTRSKRLNPSPVRGIYNGILNSLYGGYRQTGYGLTEYDMGEGVSFEEPDISDTSREEDSLPRRPLVPYRPVYSEDLPSRLPSLDRTPLTREEISRRERLEEGILRLAEWRRQEKEEYDMLAEDAMALYPGRGERLKLLRSNYIRDELRRREEAEAEAEMREEERLRSLRRRRQPSSGLRSSRRTSSRRTSPRRRDAFDTLAVGASSIASLMDRAGDYISSGFTSLRRTSPRSSTGSAKPSKPPKPSKQKVKAAVAKIPFTKTSPRKRKNPKKKRKRRIVKIKDPK